ncbi:MAG: glycosyltransferase family 4 protein [Lapillicoccus sp.]
MRHLHVVLPGNVDDPGRPSGGNTYDLKVCRGLREMGWTVNEHRAVGSWPAPDAVSRQQLRETLASIPAGAVVLVDGLVGSAVPDVLVPESGRLRIVVLVHLPLGYCPSTTSVAGQVDEGPLDAAFEREREVLTAAAAVVVTSTWTRAWVVESYGLEGERVRTVEPGTDHAELTATAESGGRLLCVGAVSRPKGHDTLVDALAGVRDLDWDLRFIGALDIDPVLVAGLAQRAVAAGVRDRLTVAGPATETEVAAAYAGADLLVLASRSETYGMVVTEALARGLPVVATAVGGVPQALGYGDGPTRPGLLVPPDDARALGEALRSWLLDPNLRRVLRAAALERRTRLPSWSVTCADLAEALHEAAS